MAQFFTQFSKIESFVFPEFSPKKYTFLLHFFRYPELFLGRILCILSSAHERKKIQFKSVTNTTSLFLLCNVQLYFHKKKNLFQIESKSI